MRLYTVEGGSSVGVGGVPSYSRADIYRDGVTCDGTSVAME